MSSLDDLNIYLVGGAVRDQLLGIPVHERDWVVTGSTVDDMLTREFRQVGRDFPVFLHPETAEEYALARTERKVGSGHTGFICHADPDVTLDQDLERRDLTINAIAKDKNGALIDPFGGQRDLQARQLKHVSDAFREDPLRILRVARFASQLEFTVAGETMALMKSMVARGDLLELTPERVFNELRKALKTSAPGQFFHVLDECGGLAQLFPEIHLDDVNRLNAVKEADDKSRFAVLTLNLTEQHLNLLCDQLKATNQYREHALMLNQHFTHWQQLDDVSNIDLVNFYTRIDGPRRPDRLSWFNQLCRELTNWMAAERDQSYQLLEMAAEAHLQVDRKTLAENYRGEAFGQALRQQAADIISQMRALRADSKND